MKLEKRKYDSKIGLPAYQLTDQFNIIVGVVACVTEEATERNTTLFQYAEDMHKLLEKCEAALHLLKMIDKSFLAAGLSDEITNFLNEMKHGT